MAKEANKKTCSCTKFTNLNRKMGIKFCNKEVFKIHIRIPVNRELLMSKSYVHAIYNSITHYNVPTHTQRQCTNKKLDQKKVTKTAKKYTPDLHMKMEETKTEEYYCVHPIKKEGQELDIVFDSKKSKVRCKQLPVSRKLNTLVVRKNEIFKGTKE